MNIYGAKLLANSFRTVRKNTIQIAEEIPESEYGFTAAAGTRSVAHLLAHIATITSLWEDLHGPKRLKNMQGYDFMSAFSNLQAEEHKHRTKAELIDLLRAEGEKFAAFLEALPEELLAETFTDGSGAEKSRLEALMSAKEHEMHHRGQLMVMQRMLGIVPHLTRRFAEMERQFKEAQAKAQTAPQTA